MRMFHDLFPHAFARLCAFEAGGRRCRADDFAGGWAVGLGVGVGTTAKARTYADAVNAIRVPGYAIGNAALYWRQPKYEVSLNIKNFTNEAYLENPTFAGGLPGDLRTLLITIKAKM
jgi:iron complex outermembrane recepter protein